MPKKTSELLLILLVILIHGSEAGTVPQQINYQGRLMDGTNLANGAYAAILCLYTEPSSGTPTYCDTQTVTVVDGLYEMQFGASNTALTGLLGALTNTPLWLECAINGQTLQPREQIASAPFSLISGSLANPKETQGVRAGRNWVIGEPGGLTTTSASFISALQFVFDGTNSGDCISRARAIVEGTDISTTIEVIIYDLSNGIIIANSPIFTPQGTQRILDLGSISNLPPTNAIFNVKFRRPSGSGNVYIRSFLCD